MSPVDLSGFDGVFGVSIAVHLAYSLISDVRNHYLNRFDWHTSYIRGQLNYFQGSPVSLEDLNLALLKFDSVWIDTNIAARARARVFAKWSLVIAVFSSACLLVRGFGEVSVPFWGVIIMLSIALLPMPAFLLMTRLYIQRRVPDLEARTHEVQQQFEKCISEHTKWKTTKNDY